MDTKNNPSLSLTTSQVNAAKASKSQGTGLTPDVQLATGAENLAGTFRNEKNTLEIEVKGGVVVKHTRLKNGEKQPSASEQMSVEQAKETMGLIEDSDELLDFAGDDTRPEIKEHLATLMKDFDLEDKQDKPQ